MPGKQNVESRRGNAAGRDIATRAASRVKVRAIHGGTNVIGNSGSVVLQIGADAERLRPWERQLLAGFRAAPWRVQEGIYLTLAAFAPPDPAAAKGRKAQCRELA